MKKMVFLIFLFSGSLCSEIPKNEIDALSEFIFEMSNAHGMVVGVVKGNETYIKGFGEIKKGTGFTPDGETIWQIGSVSKVFTGNLLGTVVFEKKLALTDPIQSYLPKDFRIPNNKSKQITFLDLATHTSGIPRLPSDMQKDPDIEVQPFRKYTEDRVKRWLKNYQLKTEPGTHYEYSNSGFGILGDVLAKTQQMSYEDLLQKYICQPLNLTHTSTKWNHQNRNKATGYNRQNEETPDWESLQIIQGSGGIYSTANDLLKFLQSNFYGRTVKEQMINKISHASYLYKSEVDNPSDMGIIDAIALGWDITYPSHGAPAILHKNGMVGGFSAWIFFVPSYQVNDGVGVVIILNKQFPCLFELGQSLIIKLQN